MQSLKAKVAWVSDNRLVASADSGHAILMEWKGDDGKQAASTPMEVVLMALGGCSSVDIVDVLRKMRVDLDALEVEIKAERAPEPPRVFTRADIEFVGSGDGLTDGAMKRAVDLSMEKYCSVAAMLKRSGCEMTYRYRVRGAAAPAPGGKASKGGAAR